MVGGADLKIVATMVGTLVFNLVVRPEIEKPEQLRGKSIGISRYGTLSTPARVSPPSTSVSSRAKTLHIVEIGAGDWIVGALQGNRVQAGVFGYPATSQAVKARQPRDAASAVAQYSLRLNRGFHARRHHPRRSRSEYAVTFRRRSEAIALMKKDRAFTLKVLSKYLRTTDMDLLAESYDVQIAKYMMKTPLTTADAVRSVLDELAERNPKAKDLDPNKFFDDRFVRQLQAGRFYRVAVSLRNGAR